MGFGRLKFDKADVVKVYWDVNVEWVIGNM